MKTKALSLAGALVALAASTSMTFAFEDGAIVIWQDDRAPDLLGEIGAQFEEDLGIQVIVENVDPLTDRFQQAAATGDGPDIVMWAHDRFGEWAAGGLISPVTPSAEVVDGNLPSAWEAVSFDNRPDRNTAEWSVDLSGMNGISLPSEGLFNHVCRFRRWEN